MPDKDDLQKQRQREIEKQIQEQRQREEQRRREELNKGDDIDNWEKRTKIPPDAGRPVDERPTLDDEE